MEMEIMQDLQEFMKLVHLKSFHGEMVTGEDLAESQFIQRPMEKDISKIEDQQQIWILIWLVQ